MGEIRKMARFTFKKIISSIVKGIVYKSCVRSAMLYGSETWCLGQNDIGILQRTDCHGDKYEWSEISGQEVGKGSDADVGLG